MLEVRNKFPNRAGSESPYSLWPMTANISTWDEDIRNSIRRETRKEEEKVRRRKKGGGGEKKREAECTYRGRER